MTKNKKNIKEETKTNKRQCIVSPGERVSEQGLTSPPTQYRTEIRYGSPSKPRKIMKESICQTDGVLSRKGVTEKVIDGKSKNRDCGEMIFAR